MTIRQGGRTLGGLGLMLLPLLTVGCAGRFCADPCHPHGNTWIQQMASGDCRPCGQAPGCSPVAQHPFDHLRVMLTSGGCGELYIDEWISDPPDCCDPCDRCGNYIGPQYCPHKRHRLLAMMGGRQGRGVYDGPCGACGLINGPACGSIPGTCGVGGACGSGFCGTPACGTGGCGIPFTQPACTTCGTEMFVPGCGVEPNCGCGGMDYRMAGPGGVTYQGGPITGASMPMAAPMPGPTPGCASCGTGGGGVNWSAMYGG